MPFSLLFDADRRILLIRFGSRLTEDRLAAMQLAAQAFTDGHGACDGIIDLSAVEEVTLSSEFLAHLASRKPVLTGHRRVIVASKEVVFGLSRMFGARQDADTGEAPAVVRTLDEAYELLGSGTPDFRPVKPD
jgi:hypothetical protein